MAIQEQKRLEGELSFIVSLKLAAQVQYYDFTHYFRPRMFCCSKKKGNASIKNDSLKLYNITQYPFADAEYSKFLKRPHTFRQRLKKMTLICKQDIEQLVLRKEFLEMVSDPLCSKLLYL